MVILYLRKIEDFSWDFINLYFFAFMVEMKFNVRKKHQNYLSYLNFKLSHKI